MICAASGGGMEILMQKIRYLTSRLDSSQKKRLGGFFVLCLLAPAADIFSVSLILPISAGFRRLGFDCPDFSYHTAFFGSSCCRRSGIVPKPGLGFFIGGHCPELVGEDV